MIAKNKTIKLLSALLIISVLAPTVLFSQPKKAEAAWFSTFVTDIFSKISTGIEWIDAQSTVTGTAISIKNVAKEVARQFLKVLAKRFLQEMTKSTINWINTGFHGNPLHLENPKSFFKDVAKFEVKYYVDFFGYNSLKYPFGKDFALNTIATYKRTLEDNTQYSLSKVINDPALLELYRNDFNVGGWNGFLINTQYPQNNYLGFNMLATEELARKVQGTAETAVGEINKTLDRGMGFLSPQICKSNKSYPPATNPFNPPSYQNTKWDPPTPVFIEDPEQPGSTIEDPISIARRAQYQQNWEMTNAVNRQNFNQKYSCPEGLENTTPGSVVGNQIADALSSGQRQGELAAAMGNSVSAILDALLNRLVDKGLSALASKKNLGPQTEDEWDYYGNTLGVVSGYGQSDWFNMPDEEIDLRKFKIQLKGKTIVTVTNPTTGEITTTEEIGNTVATTGGEYIPGDIKNTETELELMYNESVTSPGISQLLAAIWPQIRELDRCLPGPDIGWQDRLQQELERNSKKLQEKVNDDDAEKSLAADRVLKELMFAVKFFQDWIDNRMMTELPNSLLYMDAVDEIKTMQQQSDELTGKKRTRTQALARLKAIETELDKITVQPLPGSSGEKILITLRKQYTATKEAASNTITIDDARNELAVAKDKFFKLKAMVPECETARKAVGWSVPGGWSSAFNGSGGGGGGACSYLLTAGATGKIGKVREAMDAVLPAWENSTNVQGFKMAVVDWLNANGEMATPGWNGNCNSSANNLAIQTGATTGEMYEVARVGGACGNNNITNPTLGQSTPCRPEGYTGPWSFISTGVRLATPPPAPTPIPNPSPTPATPPPAGQYSITIIIKGTGTGRVSAAGGVNCSSNCSYNFPANTPLALSALADGNSTFVTWGGDCAPFGSNILCSGPMSQNRSVTATFNLKTSAIKSNFTTPGTEKELFCDKPIVGGYTHEMFVGPGTTNPQLPMVNGKNVLNWFSKVGLILTPWTGGKRKVDIELSCKAIYIARVLDYKGNIPGLTTVIEPYEAIPEDTETPLEPVPAGGACGNELTVGGTIKKAKVRQAMDAVLPAWENSTDVNRFKLAVADWLNANGETAAQGYNGNCNASANNLAVKTGATTGEMYDIVRMGAGCANEPNPTIGQATSCRPEDGYSGSWAFVSTGARTGGSGPSPSPSPSPAPAPTPTPPPPAPSPTPPPPPPPAPTATKTLTVTVNGPGSVTDGADTCNANSSCSKNYPSGTPVTITANPSAGKTFTGWGGDCAPLGTNKSCSGTMDVNHNVVANFQ